MASSSNSLVGSRLQEADQGPSPVFSTEFHASLPKKIRHAFDRGPAAGWKSWQKYLKDREAWNPADKFFRDGECPLLWSVPDAIAGSDTEELVKRLHRFTNGKRKKASDLAEQLAPWLAEAADGQATAAYAVECLAWCHAMVPLAAYVDASLWDELLRHLMEAADAGRELAIEGDLLASSLLAGELGLTLSLAFPEFKRCRKLGKLARTFLTHALVDRLDGEGMPHARHLAIARPLLASWTRCRMMAADCWNKDADNQFQWQITQTLRLTRVDGHQVLCADKASGKWSKRLFDVILREGADGTDRRAASHLLPGHSAKKPPPGAFSPAYHSEWSEMAVMRDHWSRKANHLAISYHGGQIQFELSAGRSLLFEGPWEVELLADGTPVPTNEPWDEVCWESDNDVDYLELEMQTARGLKLQRSILLARQDQFALLADALIGDHPGELQYRATLPLRNGVSASVPSETREIVLNDSKVVARLLPLALPEWRIDPRYGELDHKESAIELAQDGKRRLFAPLFIDLAPRRHSEELTWRQLAVGELRKNLGRDEAVGYRVQIGNAQWLIYRTLADCGNRTVLGQNLNCELAVGRFLKKTGEFEELIQVG